LHRKTVLKKEHVYQTLHAAREKAVVYRRTYEEKLEKGGPFTNKSSAPSNFIGVTKIPPLAAFVIGFVYDSLTLTRIDSRLDNLCCWVTPSLPAFSLPCWAWWSVAAFAVRM
jgi:hypothetical protein